MKLIRKPAILLSATAIAGYLVGAYIGWPFHGRSIDRMSMNAEMRGRPDMRRPGRPDMRPDMQGADQTDQTPRGPGQRPNQKPLTMDAVFANFSRGQYSKKISDNLAYQIVVPPEANARELKSNSKFKGQLHLVNLLGQPRPVMLKASNNKIDVFPKEMHSAVVGMKQGERRKVLFRESGSNEKEKTYMADFTLLGVE